MRDDEDTRARTRDRREWTTAPRSAFQESKYRCDDGHIARDLPIARSQPIIGAMDGIVAERQSLTDGLRTVRRGDHYLVQSGFPDVAWRGEEKRRREWGTRRKREGKPCPPATPRRRRILPSRESRQRHQTGPDRAT